TCQKSTTAPPDVTTGLCLPETAAGLPGAANIDALKNTCTDLLNARLRFRIVSAKQGTTLTFGNTPQAQVTDALVLDEIYEPEYPFQTRTCIADSDCASIKVAPADPTAKPLTTKCMPDGKDAFGADVSRCLRDCSDGKGCGHDFQCLPARHGGQRCM